MTITQFNQRVSFIYHDDDDDDDLCGLPLYTGGAPFSVLTGTRKKRKEKSHQVHEHHNCSLSP